MSELLHPELAALLTDQNTAMLIQHMGRCEWAMKEAAEGRKGKTLAVANAQQTYRLAAQTRQMREASLQMNVPADCYGPRGGLDKEKLEAYLLQGCKEEIKAEDDARDDYEVAKANEIEANNRYEEALNQCRAVVARAELIGRLIGAKQ